MKIIKQMKNIENWIKHPVIRKIDQEIFLSDFGKNFVPYAKKLLAFLNEGVEVSKPEGTYMMFIDCTKWCEAHGKTIEDVEKATWDVGVAVQDGKMFHGPCHLRMNLALPLSRVQEAFDRLDKYVFNK